MLTFYGTILTAFVAYALGQTPGFDAIDTPTNWQNVPAGEMFEIKWRAPAKYSNATISISLIGGPTQDTQNHIKTIANGIDNDSESYKWAVDSSFNQKNVYGLVLRLESDPDVFQYSFPFRIYDRRPAKTELRKNKYECPYVALRRARTNCTSSAYKTPVPTLSITNGTGTVPCNKGSLHTPSEAPAHPKPASSTLIIPIQPPVAPTQPPSQVLVPTAASPTAASHTADVISGGVCLKAHLIMISGFILATFAL
ncbi:hypothetical protein NW762_014582 [Fusarium torreyae]|uniref:Yeast cell wall synthesis Kre9/Knh1-like N-terminal domain-containing protein n=1 Tax=Fusarium torreyae TaxID=1237075 RepID=A0A9W8RL93_9HYPO|nr:hypothetical protein NW762_014582 [Fusarium torreyae]